MGQLNLGPGRAWTVKPSLKPPFKSCDFFVYVGLHAVLVEARIGCWISENLSYTWL